MPLADGSQTPALRTGFSHKGREQDKRGNDSQQATHTAGQPLTPSQEDGSPGRPAPALQREGLQLPQPRSITEPSGKPKVLLKIRGSILRISGNCCAFSLSMVFPVVMYGCESWTIK